MAKQFKANNIPKTTLEPLYEKILTKNEIRREQVKKQSIALTKQNEKPFSFHQRDLDKANREAEEVDDVSDVMDGCGGFKANPVPQHCKLNLFKRMTEQQEAARETRIKEAAELSYAQASLPPRMEAHEKARTETAHTENEGLDSNCTFKPKNAKPVPDFETLHKNFQKTLEKSRRSRSLTKPKPFVFCESNPDVGLRKYMDDSNRPQEKLMTFKAKQLHQEIKSLQKPSINPASTKKVEAAMKQRRMELENKLAEEEFKIRGDIERWHKQNRLSTRVQKSPALISNVTQLHARREAFKRDNKEKLYLMEKLYEREKAEIEYRVAQRPLLFEVQSQNFVDSLK